MIAIKRVAGEWVHYSYHQQEDFKYIEFDNCGMVQMCLAGENLEDINYTIGFDVDNPDSWSKAQLLVNEINQIILQGSGIIILDEREFIISEESTPYEIKNRER